LIINRKARKTLDNILKYGRRLVAPAFLSLAMLAPGKISAQSNDYPLSQYYNSFSQPRQTLDYYGSGDVNNDGSVNNNDYIAMQNGSTNDRADVDGDGTPSTAQDQQILSNYLNGNTSYLPGHWNSLQTRQERDSWVSKMMAIDTTDRHDYIPADLDDPNWRHNYFISGNFGTQASLNFWGWEPNSNHPETGQPMPADTMWSKYDTTNIGRFNLPVYFVGVMSDDYTWTHGMAAINTSGEDPREFSNWNFIEPQTDSTNVQPMHWDIPPNSLVRVYAPYCFGNGQEPYYNVDMIRGPPMVAFHIDSVGNTSLRPTNSIPNGYADDLILTNPNLGINPKNPRVPIEYVLNQNYPNPFNSRTNIGYSIPQQYGNSDVRLNIYDLKGRTIETLVNKNQAPGKHIVSFDASNIPSGIYLYGMSINGNTETKKMTIIK